MKRILGLDLGSSSIGWAAIEYDDQPENLKILACGSRVIPIDGQTLSKFNTGQSITVNSDRTAKRTARKTKDRYKIRRMLLSKFLGEHDMHPDKELMAMDREGLWKLRADASTRKLSLPEIGRVLLMLNVKRGYNASKSDLDPENKLQQGYVSDIKNRYQKLQDSKKTVGQYFYTEIQNNPDFRVKDLVMPRQAYLDEFNALVECQKEYYPEILTDENIKYLRDYIIFYQRPLKSCKHLVKDCEFATLTIKVDGKEKTIGPKVAHKSNPIFQAAALWQIINNIEPVNALQEKFETSQEQKQLIFQHFQSNPKITKSAIYQILGLNKRIWNLPENVDKGFSGNKTLNTLRSILGNKYKHLLGFNLKTDEIVDTSTGEIKGKIVSSEIEKEPLYRLWHTLYSISDIQNLKKVLKKQFGIEEESILDTLSQLDFVKEGYGNLSVKAIRKILPYLMEGYKYSEACEKAGFRHSDYLTKDENENRTLAKYLLPLSKGELRQPIVEKILNQMVNIVNSLIDKYGSFDEIHVEMARELRMSKDERNETSKRINQNEKKNKEISEILQKEYGLTPTKTRIDKYKLWEETDHKCIYCNSVIGVREFLQGFESEVEHIVPKSLIFDDSFSNKACSCRACNLDKGNKTAFDYMQSKSKYEFEEYVRRVNEMCDSKKISKTKMRNLLLPQTEIPSDFIDRQLRQSQYIARKSTEMLQTICHEIVATTGSVTDFLRHLWGWDMILHDLNFPRYEKSDLVEMVEVENREGTQKRNRIKNWSKRVDHRHHAIDALTIACTVRSVIQRLNTLSSLKDRMFRPFYDQNIEHKSKQSLLNKFALSLPHFTTQEVKEAMERILISVKPAGRLVSKGKCSVKIGGKTKCVQQGIIIPRGPLHEETVYGNIQWYNAKGELKEKSVKRYPIEDIKTLKDASYIVDSHIRALVQERIKEKGNSKNLWEEPLYSDNAKTKQIKKIRCFTELKGLVGIHKDDEGRTIGYVKPGANHHVAFYKDKQGNIQEHIATFKHCVDRYRLGIPAIITNPTDIWDRILNQDLEVNQEFAELLPKDDWTYQFHMIRNEMFLLGLSEDEIQEAVKTNDISLLSSHLYRLQKLSKLYYCFVLHTQTTSSPSEFNKPDKRFIRIQSIDALIKSNPHKVRINNLGELEI